ITYPLEAFKDHSKIVVDSNDDSSSSDDDSFSSKDIEYVDASPPDAEIVSLEVVEIVIPEVGGIDTDILLTIKDDILHEKFSGSPTSYSDLSLPDYEAFYLDDDHVEEKSSGSTTTHADFSQYDSFIFDLSINPFPPADRSDFYHEEFADELVQIISPPEYDYFYFKNEPDQGKFTMDVVEDIFDNPTREPRVHVPNILPTHSTLHLDLNFILSSDSLFAYVVWSFLPFLTYPVAHLYLLSSGNEDTIFDPGISIYHSFMLGVSHLSGTFMKFNVYPNHLNESPMEILSSTCSPHGPMNSGSSQAQDSVNKNKALVHTRNPIALSLVVLMVVYNCPDFEASRAHGFLLRSLELQIFSFIWEIQYPNLID
ncbi:hypothetical protein Tco_0144420, partial [Tanacetum coccineum]